MSDDDREVCEWWDQHGAHFLLRADGVVYVRQNRRWVSVERIPDGVTVAEVLHALCCDPTLTVRRRLPQTNVFTTRRP